MVVCCAEFGAEGAVAAVGGQASGSWVCFGGEGVFDEAFRKRDISLVLFVWRSEGLTRSGSHL